jgi:spermidine/putrescine transport system ATP-binding protein
MSDVIVVMKDGRIQQQGGPTELYERPVNRFVADFIGTSNFIDASVVESDAATRVVTARTSGGLILRGHLTDHHRTVSDGDAVTVATRPERLEVLTPATAGEAPPGSMQVSGRIRQGTYLGDQTEYRVDTEQAGELIVRHQNASGAGGAPGAGPGDPVIVRWHEEANLVLAG